MASNEAPIIIIKRIKKVQHGGGHGGGGAWKVAYADFVTAMMAFFLLLWLLNVTTDEQRRGIADYFVPAVASRSSSGSGGVMGGVSMALEGARRTENMRVGVSKPMSSTDDENQEITDDNLPVLARGDSNDDENMDKENLTEEELNELLAQREEKMFAAAEKALRDAIAGTPELSRLADSLVIDQTVEGLRIQIIDQERFTMFPLGSSDMFAHTKKMLEQIAKVIVNLPNKVAVTGHTDATPYTKSSRYSNWELSTDRALASRRALLEYGLGAGRITRVVGKAAGELLVPEDPTSPRNRRISMVLLREARLPFKAREPMPKKPAPTAPAVIPERTAPAVIPGKSVPEDAPVKRSSARDEAALQPNGSAPALP
ncbi:MAG: OmpA family protein [Proteobacteria bacterium]|nr:OmpA family protein [Pseudomonadota bacterium]